MYQHNNSSYDSQGRRLSSKNPFRHASASSALSRESDSSRVSSSTFDDWVQKNKTLIDLSDDEELTRPKFPALSRTGSDSDVNYNRYVLQPPASLASASALSTCHRSLHPPTQPQSVPTWPGLVSLVWPSTSLGSACFVPAPCVYTPG